MRPARLFLSTIAALALSAAALPALAAAACQGADASPAQLGADGTAAVTLCLLNEERALHGAPALSIDPLLTRAAAAHSQDMVSKKYFAHDSLSGASLVDRIAATGWTKASPAWIVGENLAWGTGTRSTPRSTMQAWMASPGHRQNVLDPGFRLIGIGLANGVPVSGNYTGMTYTTDFGAYLGPRRTARPARRRIARRHTRKLRRPGMVIRKRVPTASWSTAS